MFDRSHPRTNTPKNVDKFRLFAILKSPSVSCAALFWHTLLLLRAFTSVHSPSSFFLSGIVARFSPPPFLDVARTANGGLWFLCSLERGGVGVARTLLRFLEAPSVT